MARITTNNTNNEKAQFPNDAWVVRGKVTDKEDNPVKGLIVSVYDKDLLFDDALGTTSTDENGNFEVVYTEESFKDLFENRPDIYLKILNVNGKILYNSRKKLRPEANRIEYFSVKI